LGFSDPRVRAIHRVALRVYGAGAAGDAPSFLRARLDRQREIELRFFVATRVIELALGQIFGAGQVAAAQVGAAQVGAGQALGLAILTRLVARLVESLPS
jgi:hypothetical protein